MKRKILLLCGVFSLFAFETITAQEYEYLEITSGLNEDVIANGANTAAASISTIVDNDSFAFVAADFQPTGTSIPPAYALPVDGNIASMATPGLSYQLADYSVNNSLRIHGTTPAPTVTTGTLVFSNQVSAKKLYVLATSGSGASTVTAIVNFTDATSQTITGAVLPDWYNSTVLPVAASGFGRVSVATNNVENPSGNPRMYQLTIDIDVENQIKEIESIQFTKTSTAQGVANIFAVTAELLGSCPSPDGLTAVFGITTGAVTWAESIIEPGDGYDYYFSTSADAPTEATVPTGNVASDVMTVEFSELEIGATYYFWVRSNCGDGDVGAWVATTFTTGQISSTYTEGDIETLYNTFPTITSTTTCPGTMTISIPDGYQIGDVATSYTMTTASNGYKSEQRSLLVCTTTNTSESSLYSGTGNGGTQEYNRTDLTFANGATGEVEFELRAWRTYGSSGCTTSHNFVDNNSWTVTVTYECVTPLTPQADDQTFCTASTVADLVAATDYDDATIRWYATEESVEPLAEETVLESGTYYVSQYRYTCESERQAVVVTLGTATLPLTETEQSFCTATNISGLYVDTIEGGVINWYATADSEELLAEELVLETGSYFVSQTVGGCESDRIEVAVTINATPDAPTGDMMQDFNTGETLASLEVDFVEFGTANWYVMTVEGNYEAVDATTVLENGVTYYVSQTLLSCESEMLAITANEVLSTVTHEFSGLKVYPNPANAMITIANVGVIENVKVANLLGQTVLNRTANTETVELNVSSLAAGTYILNVQLQNGATTSVKIVKQ
ncbi:T9SS type A sorting domain-containing protein [Flavobacterium arcticum]|nr:T9SS type A sorting domain-containing protein [Flavobacterium arcticum]KAF2507381.1 T9SS type A sorting domain-containing protein [Flavobacterium arcticum]